MQFVKIHVFTNYRKGGNRETFGVVARNVMLSVSRLAVRTASTCLFSRSYGKIRELASTVPGKKPVVCSAEEVVECVKSNDKVFSY